MTFKELQRDYTIYILDKNEMKVCQGKVTSVSLPRFENKMGTTPGMVVDVTVECNGAQSTYVFPESSSKAFSGNKVFCIDKKDIVSDIKFMKAGAETALAEVNKHNQTVSKCNELLTELDTEFKEKQQLESRLDNIETMMTALMNKLNGES